MVNLPDQLLSPQSLEALHKSGWSVTPSLSCVSSRDCQAVFAPLYNMDCHCTVNLRMTIRGLNVTGWTREAGLLPGAQRLICVSVYPTRDRYKYCLQHGRAANMLQRLNARNSLWQLTGSSGSSSHRQYQHYCVTDKSNCQEQITVSALAEGNWNSLSDSQIFGSVLAFLQKHWRLPWPQWLENPHIQEQVMKLGKENHFSKNPCFLVQVWKCVGADEALTINLQSLKTIKLLPWCFCPLSPASVKICRSPAFIVYCRLTVNYHIAALSDIFFDFQSKHLSTCGPDYISQTVKDTGFIEYMNEILILIPEAFLHTSPV